MSFDPSEVGKIKLKVYLTSDGVKSVLDAGSGKILMNDATIRAVCEGKNLEIGQGGAGGLAAGLG